MTTTDDHHQIMGCTRQHRQLPVGLFIFAHPKSRANMHWHLWMPSILWMRDRRRHYRIVPIRREMQGHSLKYALAPRNQAVAADVRFRSAKQDNEQMRVDISFCLPPL